MICRNCGFENAPADAFCGSCGEFLVQQPAPADDDETQFHPTYYEPVPPPPPHAQAYGPSDPHEPPRMARPVAPGVTYGAIACWNCGRRNPSSRAFCQRCGERLSIGSLGGGRGDMARPASNRARLTAIGLGMLAVLLLAAGAATMMLGGGAPAASPTDAAAVSPSPAVSPSIPPMIEPSQPPTDPPTQAPTDSPTDEPADAPTEPPVTEPPTTPPPTPIHCNASTVPTHWANLSGGETRARVRRDEVWCIHQVVIIPDPNFGNGTIRLLIGDAPLTVVTHDLGVTIEYPHTYAPAHMVPPRTNVNYSMTCAEGDFCNAIIQVGYELLETP